MPAALTRTTLVFRRLVFALLPLLCHVSDAFADWKILTVNRENTVTIWVESASLQRRDDFVFAWIIYDRADPAEDGAMSSKVLNQYDCGNRQARTWRQSFYLKSFAGGEAMPEKGKARCEADDSLEIKLDAECVQSWKPILYMTTGADILDAMCVGKAAYTAQGPVQAR
jgi:hypothetical protein